MLNMNDYILLFKQILSKESDSLYKKISLAICCRAGETETIFLESNDLQFYINNSIYIKELKINNDSYKFICYKTENNLMFEIDSIEYLLLEDIVSILIHRIEERHTNKVDILTQKTELLLYKALLDYFIVHELPDINLINYISGLDYEKRPCYGKILFVNNKDGISGKLSVQFEASVFFNTKNSRMIRKYIELVRKKAYLVVELSSFLIVGIIYNLNMNDVLEYGHIIEFKGHLNWILYYKRALIEYINGGYFLAADAQPYVEYCSDTRKMFANLPAFYMDKLETFYKLVDNAKEQGHGTLIILSDDATKEAERLVNCNRGIKINPMSIVDNMNIIPSITSIDGALLIDWDFNCHAIGVILDGPACLGEISRGARYNSALTYVQWKKNENCVCAIVISEDKIVNLIY